MWERFGNFISYFLPKFECLIKGLALCENKHTIRIPVENLAIPLFIVINNLNAGVEDKLASLDH